MVAALLTLAVFLAAWTVAWFVFIRRWLMQYKFTADVVGRMESAEGDAWAIFKIWLEGKKALAVAFVTSLFGAGKAAIDSTISTAASLTPTDVTQLHDPNIWHAFFSDAWVLRIMSALAIVTALLSLRGKVTAAQIVPKG